MTVTTYGLTRRSVLGGAAALAVPSLHRRAGAAESARAHPGGARVVATAEGGAIAIALVVILNIIFI